MCVGRSGARSGDTVLRVDLLGRRPARVLEDAGLVADVQEVVVLAVRLGGGRLDVDAVARRVGEQVGPSLELREELRRLPRRDDLDLRVQRIVGQLEAHLVVALARGAVRDERGLLPGGHGDLVLGDQRPRERGAEQVAPLVDGVRLEGREDEVGDELLLEVLDVDRAGARLEGLLPHLLEVVALADVRDEGDDLVAAFDEPLQDHGRVQTAAVRQNDLLAHVCLPCPSRVMASSRFQRLRPAGTVLATFIARFPVRLQDISWNPPATSRRASPSASPGLRGCAS